MSLASAAADPDEIELEGKDSLLSVPKWGTFLWTGFFYIRRLHRRCLSAILPGWRHLAPVPLPGGHPGPGREVPAGVLPGAGRIRQSLLWRSGYSAGWTDWDGGGVV